MLKATIAKQNDIAGMEAKKVTGGTKSIHLNIRNSMTILTIRSIKPFFGAFVGGADIFSFTHNISPYLKWRKPLNFTTMSNQ